MSTVTADPLGIYSGPQSADPLGAYSPQNQDPLGIYAAPSNPARPGPAYRARQPPFRPSCAAIPICAA